MKVARTVADLRREVAAWRARGERIGLVPTMGAIHAGHLALVAAGRAEAYRESGSMIWDVAAGCALVEAAGGEFRIDGAALDQPLEVSAGNGAVALPQ